MKLSLANLFSLLIISIGITKVNAKHDSVKAAPYSRSGLSGRTLSACSLVVGVTATFCDQSSPYARMCYCVDPNALATIAGCYHLANRVSQETVEGLSESCAELKRTITLDDFEAAYKNYTSLAKETSDIKNFNATIPVDVPVKLNSSSVKLYIDAYDQFLGNYDDSLYYGSGVLGYWALVFLIVTVVNWTKIISPG
ncbi:uncharacterized protein AC631_05951, partial [Debaryomyces fabryi]